MGKWIHRIIDVDEPSRTGTCAHCGPVIVRRRGAPHTGWRCGRTNPEVRANKPNLSRAYQKQKKDACENPSCTAVTIDPCQRDVHHLDGDRKNNELDNLQTLCANCHRLATFRGMVF
jgi:5-methylcytosine-specific restriction endonuclease McrA